MASTTKTSGGARSVIGSIMGGAIGSMANAALGAMGSGSSGSSGSSMADRDSSGGGSWIGSGIHNGAPYQPSGGGGGGGGGGSSGGGSDIAGDLQKKYDQYYGMQAQMAYEAQVRAQHEAAVQQSVNSLNAQKGGVRDAGDSANRAAYSAYMDVMKPGGAMAEQLAARGLTQSGYSEGSMIDAGNTLQNSYNSNGKGVNDTLADIDLAISNAQLTGDMQTAQQLANYRLQVQQAGMANANNIASIGQWQTEFDAGQNQQAYQNGQNQNQQAFQNALAQQQANNQQATGDLNNQMTQTQIEQAKLQLEQERANLDLFKKMGLSQAQAELAAKQAATQGQTISNMSAQEQLNWIRKYGFGQ